MSFTWLTDTRIFCVLLPTKDFPIFKMMPFNRLGFSFVLKKKKKKTTIEKHCTASAILFKPEAFWEAILLLTNTITDISLNLLYPDVFVFISIVPMLYLIPVRLHIFPFSVVSFLLSLPSLRCLFLFQAFSLSQ